MVGGIGGFGSIIAFAAFYRVRIRKDKAEGQVAGKARRHRIYKAIEGYHRRVVGRKPTDKGQHTGNDTKPTGEDREAGEAGQGLAGAVGRDGMYC